MTLDQIAVFMAVVELGSLSKASKYLHKTKPAISASLKTLEVNLGITLLSRDGYRLEVTEEGKQMLPHFNNLLEQQKRIELVSGKLTEESETKIQIVYDCYCQLDGLFDVVANTKKLFPATEIHLSMEHRLGSLARLLDGTAEIAISPWLPNFMSLGDFRTEKIFPRTVQDVISSKLVQQLDCDLDSITLADLSQLTHIIFQDSKLDLDDDAYRGTTLSPTLKTGDFITQRALILNSGGWGPLAIDTIQEELKNGDLIKLNIKDAQKEFKVDINIVRMSGIQLGRVGLEIWDQITNFDFS